MAELLLFHHAHGLTAGCRALADDIRAAGHVVHTPDLYDGRTFDDRDAGVAHAEQIGFGTLLERGRVAAEKLPHDLVYAGLSLGVLPAQMLAQTRPGAKGAVFLHGAVPPSEFGRPWPVGVPLQIHVMDGDELGDLDVARGLVDTVDGAELHLYPGDGHLFTDPGLSAHDAGAAATVRQRMLAFLDRHT